MLYSTEDKSKTQTIPMLWRSILNFWRSTWLMEPFWIEHVAVYHSSPLPAGTGKFSCVVSASHLIISKDDAGNNLGGDVVEQNVGSGSASVFHHSWFQGSGEEFSTDCKERRTREQGLPVSKGCMVMAGMATSEAVVFKHRMIESQNGLGCRGP